MSGKKGEKGEKGGKGVRGKVSEKGGGKVSGERERCQCRQERGKVSGKGVRKGVRKERCQCRHLDILFDRSANYE